MEHNNDTKTLKDRLDEIFTKMKHNGCDALIVHDNHGNLQLAQADVFDRFRTCDDFVAHMAGTPFIYNPAAAGFLDWTVESLGVQHRTDDRQIYEVVIKKPFRF